SSDAVLLDGTFWSSDELARVKSGASSADAMGHVTIREHSLEWLRKSAARHKIYLHINNTNPILAPDSPQRAAVEAAGVTVGYDGMEFEI
ncbi:MAG TPA: pyrroloquinoline quinone biosynthesis protein PqqB, partial [Verrucomicrobiae bacterium]|nr:pyrroloquinoline quinone biosynthesis protein PqqB [Verrucomicrobiae bacterium]